MLILNARAPRSKVTLARSRAGFIHPVHSRGDSPLCGCTGLLLRTEFKTDVDYYLVVYRARSTPRFPSLMNRKLYITGGYIRLLDKVYNLLRMLFSFFPSDPLASNANSVMLSGP